MARVGSLLALELLDRVPQVVLRDEREPREERPLVPGLKTLDAQERFEVVRRAYRGIFSTMLDWYFANSTRQEVPMRA